MGILKKLTKAVVDTALLPVDVAKDSVSLGGVSDDRNESYSTERLRKVQKSLKGAYDELEKD
jgi:hypothetical protein